VVGHVCFMIILSLKLQLPGNYVHLALVLEKAVLEESLAKHLPLLSCIGFSLIKNQNKTQCFVNNGIHVIQSSELSSSILTVLSNPYPLV